MENRLAIYLKAYMNIGVCSKNLEKKEEMNEAFSFCKECV